LYVDWLREIPCEADPELLKTFDKTPSKIVASLICILFNRKINLAKLRNHL
jgi:hypothetical protein